MFDNMTPEQKMLLPILLGQQVSSLGTSIANIGRTQRGANLEHVPQPNIGVYYGMVKAAEDSKRKAEFAEQVKQLPDLTPAEKALADYDPEGVIKARTELAVARERRSDGDPARLINMGAGTIYDPNTRQIVPVPEYLDNLRKTEEIKAQYDKKASSGGGGGSKSAGNTQRERAIGELAAYNDIVVNGGALTPQQEYRRGLLQKQFETQFGDTATGDRYVQFPGQPPQQTFQGEKGEEKRTQKERLFAQTDVTLDQMRGAFTAIKDDPTLVGVPGLARRWMEYASGTLAPGSPEPARDVAHVFDVALSQNVKEILSQSGNTISNKDMERAERILSGGTVWATQQSALRDIRWLYEKVKLARGAIAKGAAGTVPPIAPSPQQPAAPQQGTAPARATSGWPPAGTVKNGYISNGGDPSDPKTWTPVK